MPSVGGYQMKYDGFSLVASPHVIDASCKCGATLREVSNGFLSSAMFCPTCESIYILRLVKLPASKVSEEFLMQAREESK